LLFVYNIKYEIALEYLNNLYYIEDKLYNNEKLDFLFNVKKELIEMIWKLNNKVDITMWIEYNKRFNSLLKVSTSKEILMLLDILGETLLKTTPFTKECNEARVSIIENLDYTKKLIK